MGYKSVAEKYMVEQFVGIKYKGYGPWGEKNMGERLVTVGKRPRGEKSVGQKSNL